MGGSDDESNLVELLPEEHYTAHLLLLKMHPEVSGLVFACVMMSTSLPGRNNKLYGWVRRITNARHSDVVRDAWARKYGFCDYSDQCVVIWNLYVMGNYTVQQISEKYSMSMHNVNSSLRHWSVCNGLEDKLREARRLRRSNASKIVRANFTPEQEARRIAATKAYDYTERNRKMSIERRGPGNPVYGMRWKRGEKGENKKHTT